MDPSKHRQNYRQEHVESDDAPSFPRFFIVFVLVVIGAALLYYYFSHSVASDTIPASVVMRLDRETITLVERTNAEPCNVTVANMLATRLLNKAEFAATLSFLNGMEKKCALDANLQAIKLHAQKGSSDFAGAEATATAIIHEHPSSAEAYSWRSAAREGLGNIQGAYDDMRKALYLLPDPSMASSHVFYELSRFAAKLGNYCEAVNILRDYIAYDYEKRRTQQVETMLADWQSQGNCPSPFGKGSARFRYAAGTGVVVLPVTINGVSTRMIIDTGASRTLLTKDVAERAGIKPAHELGSLTITANGVTWHAGGRADVIALGDATSHKVPVFIQTTETHSLGEGIGGLLGMSFLGNFKFSMSRGTLELKPLN